MTARSLQSREKRLIDRAYSKNALSRGTLPETYLARHLDRQIVSFRFMAKELSSTF
jgi:hypothetical protein